MSHDELDARWQAAQRRDRMRFWAPVVVACIAMVLSGIGLLLTSTRVDHNDSRISSTRSDAKVAQKTAAGARVDLDDIIRVLKKKKIVKDGRNGLQGSTGPRGAVGPRGPQGLRGAPGAAGRPGTDGTDARVTQSDLLAVLTSFCNAHNCRGPQGERGFVGAPGPQGPAGPAMQRHFVVTFPRSDGSTASLTCDDPEGDGTYACAPSPA